MLIIGHLDHTRKLYPKGMGEISHTKILQEHLQCETVDIYKAFNVHKKSEKQAFYAGKKQPTLPPANTQILCTYTWALNAAIQANIHKRARTIGRIFPLQEFLRIPGHLYNALDMNMTQSLLGLEMGHEVGVPLHKMLYVPLQKIPERPIKSPNHQIVGTSARFLYGKNIDFLIQAFHRVIKEEPNARLYLHGDFDPNCDIHDGEDYTERLKPLLNQPWIIHDKTHYTDMSQLYSKFDIAVHPSGVEDPSNTIAEMIGHGLPTIILEGGPKESLYKNAALFSKHRGYTNIRRGCEQFFIPDIDDLSDKILLLLKDRSARHTLAKEGRRLALKRFTNTKERLDLLLHGTPDQILAAHLDDYDRFDRTPRHDLYLSSP